MSFEGCPTDPPPAFESGDESHTPASEVTPPVVGANKDTGEEVNSSVHQGEGQQLSPSSPTPADPASATEPSTALIHSDAAPPPPPAPATMPEVVPTQETYG